MRGKYNRKKNRYRSKSIEAQEKRIRESGLVSPNRRLKAGKSKHSKAAAAALKKFLSLREPE